MVVLLVADEPLIAYLAEGLKAIGATVLTVSTPEQAILALGACKVDLAIVDALIESADCTAVANACKRNKVRYVITSGVGTQEAPAAFTTARRQ